MKTKKDIKILFENGLTFSTIKNLTPNQVKVLVEKFTKKDEVDEAVTTTQQTGYKTTITPGSPANLNVNGTDISVDPSKGITMMSPTKPVGTGETTEGEVSEETEELDEKFESRAQQKLFFAKCGNGKTKEQKKWCKLEMNLQVPQQKRIIKKCQKNFTQKKLFQLKKERALKKRNMKSFLKIELLV